jgi:homoserine O-acetyltransferase
MSSLASSFISSNTTNSPKFISSIAFFGSDNGMLIPDFTMKTQSFRPRRNTTQHFLTAPQPARPLIQDEEFSWILPNDFISESGSQLAGCEVKARLVGPKNAPVILTLGGISANRHACPKASENISGWWPEMVGENQVLNTAQYRILSFDFLPGNDAHVASNPEKVVSLDGGTPEHLNSLVKRDAPSPSRLITTGDQARIAKFICKQINIHSLYALVGASYGGMVSLSFAQQFPGMAERVIVLCAAHRPHPMGSAWRSIQRKLVRFGLETGQPDKALSLARELGMTTYRTSQEFGERFAICPEQAAQKVASPVEAYLESRGQAFLGTMSPQRYLSLSESIDTHYIDPSSLNANLTLIGCRQDQLVPIEELRLLASGSKGNARVVEFDSYFGHDAFLKETDIISKALQAALKPCC